LREPSIFPIDSFQDQRGKISFCNDFDFSKFKRFYTITPAQSGQIRAWQGHRYEEKAFMVLKGEVKLVVIPVFDFRSEKVGFPKEFTLTSSDPQLVLVPGGYLNGFQFLSSGSSIFIISFGGIKRR
jgi:dTDP-4-dehydrorhamnose 3,5-epimerase and related enzymes